MTGFVGVVAGLIVAGALLSTLGVLYPELIDRLRRALRKFRFRR